MQHLNIKWQVFLCLGNGLCDDVAVDGNGFGLPGDMEDMGFTAVTGDMALLPRPTKKKIHLLHNVDCDFKKYFKNNPWAMDLPLLKILLTLNQNTDITLFRIY